MEAGHGTAAGEAGGGDDFFCPLWVEIWVFLPLPTNKDTNDKNCDMTTESKTLWHEPTVTERNKQVPMNQSRYSQLWLAAHKQMSLQVVQFCANFHSRRVKVLQQEANEMIHTSTVRSVARELMPFESARVRAARRL